MSPERRIGQPRKARDRPGAKNCRSLDACPRGPFRRPDSPRPACRSARGPSTPEAADQDTQWGRRRQRGAGEPRPALPRELRHVREGGTRIAHAQIRERADAVRVASDGPELPRERGPASILANRLHVPGGPHPRHPLRVAGRGRAGGTREDVVERGGDVEAERGGQAPSERTTATPRGCSTPSTRARGPGSARVPRPRVMERRTLDGPGVSNSRTAPLRSPRSASADSSRTPCR
jgi:hypothetical protein